MQATCATLRHVQWSSIDTWLLAIHVLANVVWIGALICLAWVVSRAPYVSNAAELGAVGRRAYLQVAVPAFVTSFCAGLARFVLYAGTYAHMPWMHAKLTFALVVIVLHHVLGARVRKVAGGNAEAARSMPVLAGMILAGAAAAVLLGVFKSLP